MRYRQLRRPDNPSLLHFQLGVPGNAVPRRYTNKPGNRQWSRPPWRTLAQAQSPLLENGLTTSGNPFCLPILAQSQAAQLSSIKKQHVVTSAQRVMH